MLAFVLAVATATQTPGPLVAPPNAQPAPKSTDAADPGAFTRVHLAGDIDLDVFSSESTRASTIDCPTSQGPGLQLQVQGDTLMVTPMHEGNRTSSTCKLILKVPTLAGIQVSGASTVRGGALKGLSDVQVAGAADLDLRGIQSDSFSLQVSGAGSARLSGKVDSVSLITAGAAAIQAKDLTAQTGVLKSAGAGNISATLKKSGQATSAGAGTITVYGQPESLQQAAHGVGRIVKK